jgi:hypothetical protein
MDKLSRSIRILNFSHGSFWLNRAVRLQSPNVVFLIGADGRVDFGNIATPIWNSEEGAKGREFGEQRFLEFRESVIAASARTLLQDKIAAKSGGENVLVGQVCGFYTAENAGAHETSGCSFPHVARKDF